jgi:hypothetical protein
MAAQELVTPTPFMRSLSAANYDALKKDVEQRLKKGKEGLEALRRVINQSGNTKMKEAYENPRTPLKVRMSFYRNIKNGFSDISEFKVDNSTKQKIINVYNVYLKQVEEAGKGSIKYDLVSSVNGRTILLFDSLALLGSDVTNLGRYVAVEALDRYAFKAVSDYMFRYILHSPNFGTIGYTSTQATSLLLSTLNVTAPNEATSDPFLSLLNDTPGGTLGVLNGILDKLNNYVAGEDEFTQPPSVDTADEITELLNLETKFNDFLNQYNIGFNLNRYFISKSGMPRTLTENLRLDYLKKAFYNVITPSEQLNSITNTKYVQNIWNKIKESRTTRFSCICRFC